MANISDFFNKPRMVVSLTDEANITSTVDTNGQLINSLVIIPDVAFKFSLHAYDVLLVTTISSIQASLVSVSGRDKTILPTVITITSGGTHFYVLAGTVATVDWAGTDELKLLLAITDATGTKHIVELPVVKQ